jgi:hypothetical protein
MANISRSRRLRSLTHVRDYLGTPHERGFLLFAHRVPIRMNHPSTANAIALDKILPLSHLHDPQHLIDHRSFATRAGTPDEVTVLEIAGARNSKIYRGPVKSRCVSNNKFSKVGAGPRSAA